MKAGRIRIVKSSSSDNSQCINLNQHEDVYQDTSKQPNLLKF